MKNSHKHSQIGFKGGGACADAARRRAVNDTYKDADQWGKMWEETRRCLAAKQTPAPTRWNANAVGRA